MPALTPAARLRLWLVQTGQGRTGFYSDSRFWNGSVDRHCPRHLSRQLPGKQQSAITPPPTASFAPGRTRTSEA